MMRSLSSCLDATRMWRNTERASLEKKPSMRLSQEPCVGVKVNSKRCAGCCAIQALVSLKNPNCPIVPTPANLVVTNQTRTNSRRSLFFEDVVDRGLVLIGDIRNGGRQREHHMEVRHRQQIGLARGEPFLGGGALALGTMPVAATVVGDDRVGAALATCHMPA